jgi:hypothetical protein
MRLIGPAPSLLLLLCLLPGPARADQEIVQVTTDPSSIRLSGPNAVYSLLVHGKTADGRLVDLTGAAHFRSSDAKVARVSTAGVIKGLADGSTTILVEAAGRSLTIPVEVKGVAQPRRFNFENDIVSLLSRFGCNSAGCHGKAEGQNGFKLSVFGFDPEADYAALTKEGRGRRVFPAAAENSLLLKKISGRVAHGGGVRIPRASAEYATIRDWIAAGTPFGRASDPRVVKIKVEPAERLLAMRSRQQLRVVARYSDGREADVTHHAKFQSNNDGLATVNETGLVRAADAPGDVAIMASYMNAVDVFRALIPRAQRIEDYPKLPVNNFIDKLVFAKLRKLNILPSELAGDADFLRRAYLDVIGTLPTAEEARRFLDDKGADKRARLVDALLDRPEFADYWALKWADLLRVDSQALGNKRAYSYYKWIRDSLAANKPLDRFARELVAAEGPLREVGPASFYQVVSNPGDRASTLSQVFLGVRLACAQCHHHPFDRWSQTDYYGMSAYFTSVTVSKSSRGQVLLTTQASPTRHPRTGETILAHPLGGAMPAKPPEGDRRAQLADWLASPDNPWFARNLANRTWAHFLGRGLVEPVDDVRATNPPINPELLDSLAKELIADKFDFKKLIRTITASRVYQLSSKPNATNQRDEQNYSRARFKRIDAEVLLDMVCQTTGIGEKFPGVPGGCRAIQLWDSKTPHYFLKLFGRPTRVSACECERNHEPSVSQVLHLLNSPEIHDKLSHQGGVVAGLVKRLADDDPLVDELYLTFHSRRPTERERSVAVKYLKENRETRRKAAEDLAWALMNSLEFVFNH